MQRVPGFNVPGARRRGAAWARCAAAWADAPRARSETVHGHGVPPRPVRLPRGGGARAPGGPSDRVAAVRPAAPEASPPVGVRSRRARAADAHPVAAAGPRAAAAARWGSRGGADVHG